MTIGPHTLGLASALVAEKRLEAEIPRRWRITPASGISARATPQEEPASRHRRHGWHHPHRLAVGHR